MKRSQPPKMHEEIAADLANGSYKVIVEAREAGKGVGIYDKDGKPKAGRGGRHH